MFKTTHDLQEFILWCQQVKVKTVKVGDVEVQFSDLAYLDTIQPLEKGTEEKTTSKTMVDTEQPESDDELLFWSSKA